MPRKTIVLSNKLFHKLWDSAKDLSEQEYIDLFLKRESDDFIDFERKYDIEAYIASKILKRIYEYYNLSFEELIRLTKLKNSEIADRYCIGIRNVQQWVNGKAKCPPYVKLMILRDEHMMNFDGFVTTEWEMRFKTTYPPVYEKKKTYNEKSYKKVKNENIEFDFEKYDKYKNELHIKTDINRILEETAYLNRIIEAKKA